MKNKVTSLVWCDAVVLAGGPELSGTSPLPNKTFMKLKGRALFIHVLSALLDVERLGTIFVVGPKDELEQEIKDCGLAFPDGKVIVYQSLSNIVQNVWHPFLQSLNGYCDGDELIKKEVRNRPIFVTAGDCPLMTSVEVNQFLDGCWDIDSYDWFMGMTAKSTLGYYEPRKGSGGITFVYSHFAENLLRVNNLHLITPFRVGRRDEFHNFYEVRYLKRFSNVIKSGFGLLKRGLDLDGLLGWFEMLLAMNLRRVGLDRLSDIVRAFVPIERGERVVGKLLDARGKIVITTYGGCALDVDRKRNKEAIEDMYDEWMEHQRSMAKTQR